MKGLIGFHPGIVRDQRQSLNDGLRHKHSVKGVCMMRRQGLNGEGVLGCEIQRGETMALQLIQVVT